MNTMQTRKEIGRAITKFPPKIKCNYIGQRHKGVRLNGQKSKLVSRCVPN